MHSRDWIKSTRSKSYGKIRARNNSKEHTVFFRKPKIKIGLILGFLKLFKLFNAKLNSFGDLIS